MSSDLALGVSVGGVPEAERALQRVGQATTQTATTTRAAEQASGNFGNTAQNVAQRVQGMASQVAALSGRLGGGGIGQAAGLVASLAGVTTNALAMGATMGPAGIVVGAISGLMPLLADWVGSNEHVGRSTIDLTDTQHNFQIQLGHSADAVDALVEANRRLATQEAERSRIDQGLGSVDQQFAAANLAGARVGALRAQDAALRQERARMDETDWRNAERLHEIDVQRAALATQIRDAHAESQRLGQLAIQAESDELEIQNDLVTTAMDAANEAAHAADAAERHSHAARATAEHTRQTAISAAQAAASEQSFIAEMMRAAHTDSLPGLGFGDAASDATIAQLATLGQRTDHAASATRSLISAQRDLASQARPTNAALASVASTVGGTFQSAFQGAVNAWLDGSKSFVQAAEAMAKGVIKALVSEAIVQGVVELARGIADIASYHYDSGAEHFAAAAAWAGVGAAAGAAGAAIGAFGGAGASTGAGATTRDTASASRESQNQAANGSQYTFYVYPGNVITRADQAAAIQDVLDHGVRNGIIRRAA
jgi:hypothetical protein